jgi:hypothetical protein
MRRAIVLLASLLVAVSSLSAPPGSLPKQDIDAGAGFLAMLPPQRLAQVPPAVIDAVRRAKIPTERFAGSQGFALPFTVMGAPSDLQSKQFITHWLDHYICLGAGIDEDYVDEASIKGRCSGQKMSDGPAAPIVDPEYSANPSGAMMTGYWQVPVATTTGATRTTNLSRYFVTVVSSPTARNVRVWFGASDYFKLWINGTLVLSRNAGGPKPWTVDEYKANVALGAGWNVIAVKHSFPQLGPETDPNEDNKYKWFSLRFVSDDTGTPVTDLVAAFDPGCTEGDASWATRAWVPNVAHLPGYSSQWRTDLYLFNGTHMKWAYRLRFYKEGNNSGLPDAEKFLEIEPFQVLTFPDAIQTLFQMATNAKGYVTVLQQLFWRWLSFGPQEHGWLQAKTFNLTEGGTFGTLDPVLLHFYSTLSRTTFLGLRNGAFRSNLTIFPETNAGASAKIRLTLSGPDIVTPLVKEYSGISGFWQLNNVFRDLGAGSVNTDSATLSVEFLENPTSTLWFPYVMVLDGNPQYGTAGTSDPVYLSPAYIPLLPPSSN